MEAAMEAAPLEAAVPGAGPRERTPLRRLLRVLHLGEGPEDSTGLGHARRGLDCSRASVPEGPTPCRGVGRADAAASSTERAAQQQLGQPIPQ